LLGNQTAGDVLAAIRELAAGGIEFHAQIVLCPGVNDREVFYKTYRDLFGLNDSILSVAAVPVGLTKFRTSAAQSLRGFTGEEARGEIEEAAGWQRECRQHIGRRFIYPSDEFYVLAGAPFPPDEANDGFAQYENGVGICRKFLDDWHKEKINAVSGKKDFCVVCGCSALPALADALAETEAALGGRNRLLAVENEFFGKTVTVTGLLTGQDILRKINTLSDKPSRVVLPGIALKSKAEPVFLDGMAADEMARALAGVELSIAWSAAQLKHILYEGRGGGIGRKTGDD
jgi:NifB/MoaA-like Fe-S oxidoreductase